jgi:flagellar hook-associated protein 2
MPGLISVGGLATGLDSNKLIEQLVALERRPVVLVQRERDGLEATQSAIGTLRSKLAALRSALGALDTAGEVLARKASSSSETVLAAAAGSGAARGSTTLTVTQLARGAIASSSSGVAATTQAVASGAGTFSFQVGSGSVQSVTLSATTTLEQLVNEINDLNAGVTASAVNLGTSASPDFRLQIVSNDTGASNDITVVTDGTTIGVATTQTAQNAQFTVSGFAGTFARETNSFSDVLPGVTFSLKSNGTSTVTVDDDPDAIVEQIEKLVAAYNEIVSFVAGESDITQDGDSGDVTIDSLAADTTVRLALGQLQQGLAGVVSGLTGPYVNLAGIGIATQHDGTVLLDETALRAALADDAAGFAQVFAGVSGVDGVAGRLSDLIDALTGAGGSLDVREDTLAAQLQALEDDIDAGERRAAALEESLRAQFAALEQLVADLQSQGAYLASVFGSR